MKLKLPSVFHFLGTALLLISVQQAVVSQEETGNIAEIASALDDFSTLVSFLSPDQEIFDRLVGDAPITVFAPTNDAFEALPPATVAFLQANPDILSQVLLYHAVEGTVPSSAISDDPMVVQTLLSDAQVIARRHLSGSWCWLLKIGCTEIVTINDSTVVIADVPASNGVIHAIDKVLMPPGLALLDIVDTAIKAHLDTLVAAVSATELVEVLRGPGPFTVFAPSEEAWRSLPAGLLETLLKPENVSLLTDILRYHLIVGSAVDSNSIISEGLGTVTMDNGDEVVITFDAGNVLVNDATVIAADVGVTNGIVHVINKILIPPDVEVPQDIVDIALGDSDLTSLVAALVEANLVGALDTAGPFTVLAPTNAAFAELGDTSLDKQTLQDILLYHVIPGNFSAEIVVTLDSAPTLLHGKSVPIRVEDGRVFVGEDTEVIATDIFASNGVIHKIDAVLMPEKSKECPYYDFICDFLGWLYM